MDDEALTLTTNDGREVVEFMKAHNLSGISLPDESISFGEIEYGSAKLSLHHTKDGRTVSIYSHGCNRQWQIIILPTP